MKNDLTGKDRNLSLHQDGQEHFERLFRAYYDPLCHYSYAILGDFSEAEDVVQDLFTYLWKNKEEVKFEREAKAYLYSSVRYRALNVLKHKVVMRRNNPLLLQFIQNIQQEGYSEEEELKIEKINEVLNTLPPQCKTVFTMSCLDGKKYKEIAQELGISVNTVKFHITKAYREIREKVGSIDNPMLLLLVVRNDLKPVVLK